MNIQCLENDISFFIQNIINDFHHLTNCGYDWYAYDVDEMGDWNIC